VVARGDNAFCEIVEGNTPMRGDCRDHRWLLCASLCAIVCAHLGIEQSADARTYCSWLIPTTDGGALAAGLPFLAWLKGVDFGRMIDAAVGVVTKFLTGKASTLPSQPAQPQTTSASVESHAVDDEGTGETVLVNPLSLGSITFVTGTLVGRRWEIPPQGLTIGRDPRSDVVLTEKQVSVKHALIRPKEGKVVIVDDGSMNGIFLNKTENRVQGEAPLENGDLVMLSSSTDATQFIYRR
jgi:FHA domain